MDKVILVLLFFGSVHVCVGQQFKYEKETRIKEKNVNPSAQAYVSSLGFKKKVKWFKEIGYERESIEAKISSNDKKYSIEFLMDGTLEDVEIGAKISTLPSHIQQVILSYLSAQYEDYSIDKTQIQYSGDPEEILNFLKYGVEYESILTRYEIVINTKSKGSFKSYEYLFSTEGEVVHRMEIVRRNIDNIEY